MKTVIDRIEERLVWMEIRNKPIISLPALALLTVQQFYAFVSLCDVKRDTIPHPGACSAQSDKTLCVCLSEHLNYMCSVSRNNFVEGCKQRAKNNVSCLSFLTWLQLCLESSLKNKDVDFILEL